MRPRNPERVRAWRDRIDEWKRSGQSIHAFCRDHHLTRSNVDRWRRILAAESGSAPTTSAPVLVPVHVAAEPMAEVVLRTGVVVRLPLGATAEAVTRLVAAVGAAGC